MAVAYRGSSTTSGVGGAYNAPLPTGSVAGDWVLVGMICSGSSVTLALNSGITSLYNGAMGSGMIALGKKQLTSTDITNGYLSLSNSSSSDGARTVILGFYGCDGFATAGSMTFRSGSSNTITAAATTAATGQKVVVIRFEKSSNNPGPTSPSPATTLLTQWYTNAAAAPSYYFGWYDGPAATRTFTDPVASANGMGVQIALIDSSVSTSPTVSVWDGTSEVTGCTVSVWNGTSEVAGSTVEIV